MNLLKCRQATGRRSGGQLRRCADRRRITSQRLSLVVWIRILGFVIGSLGPKLSVIDPSGS